MSDLVRMRTGLVKLISIPNIRCIFVGVLYSLSKNRIKAIEVYVVVSGQKPSLHLQKYRICVEIRNYWS